MPFICMIGCPVPVLSMLTSYLWASGRLMMVVYARLAVLAMLISATLLGISTLNLAAILFVAGRFLVLFVLLTLSAGNLGPRRIAATLATLVAAMMIILPVLWI